MMLAAAEGATQIPSTGVTRMREKANSTVDAVSNTLLQIRMGLQQGVECVLILPDERVNAAVEGPVLGKRK
jgi:hypothetical protein